jgi:hypothetical protein
VAAPAAKAAPKAATPTAPVQLSVSPDIDWDKFFATTKFEKPRDAEVFLLQTVGNFIKSKKFDRAEVVLKLFLKYHAKEAGAWMYVFLAECIKARNGTEAELKTTLGYAAHLAKKTKKSEDLIRVADMLVLRKLYGTVGEPGFQTNIGELVDMASDQVPTNAWPIMMSVNLATHDKDPKRMADAAERLLAIGWPGYDDRVRRDLKDQVKYLADSLKTDGRAEEASSLMASLAESEVRDIFIKLTWKGEADIDLAVLEPLGVTANFQNFRTVCGGAIIQNGYGKQPEEIYVAPRAFDGEYKISTEKIVDYDEKKPVLEATLQVILHEGSPSETRQTYKLDLAKPEPITVSLPQGGGRRKTPLPFIAPPPPPIVISKPKDRKTKAEMDKAAVSPNPSGAPLR